MFSRLLPDDGTVCLYGAGKTGRRALGVIREMGIRVPFLLDNAAARIGEVDGVPVLDPNTEIADPAFPVVLAIFNRDTDTIEIARLLLRRGYKRIIPYPVFHSQFPNALGDHFWLGDPALPNREADMIRRTQAIWSDQVSRETFGALLELYRTRDPSFAPAPLPRDQEYLPPDMAGWPPTGPIRLVDGGAFDGDTLELIRRAGFLVEAAACFEPDPENFQRMTHRVHGWPRADQQGTLLWPCGLAQRTGIFPFASGEGEASHLASSDSGTLVTCVALDDALPGFGPTLVKLDVEGAEEAALQGATLIINQSRPGLAVSVYHRPADLWRLPTIIDRWRIGYRLYLRSYGFNGFDTVCYAVP